MFKFVDRETGRMLALRADITPADRAHRRHAPARRAQALPPRVPDQRLPLRRAARRPHPRVLPGGRRADRPRQAGGRRRDDRDGHRGVLRALGLERFQIDVGHAEFFRGVLESLGVGGRRRAGAARRPSGARTRPSSSGSSASWPPARDGGPPAGPARRSRAAPRCLARRRRSCRTRGRSARWPTWRRCYRLLSAYGLADAVLLDLGEVRGFDYYSGVHFEAYVDGLRRRARGRRPVRPDARRASARVPGDRLRVRREPRSCSPWRRRVSSRRLTGPGVLHHRLHRGQGHGARALPAPARAGPRGGAGHHQPAARGVARLRARHRAARAVVIEHAGPRAARCGRSTSASGQESAVPARGAAWPRPAASSSRRPEAAHA